MDNQTAVLWQLIATVAGVVVVLWYSLETRWLRQETKNLLNEARLQNETALRPIIDFYFSETGVPGDQKTMKVRNVGRGPAFGLYAMPIKCHANSSISMVLPESLPVDAEEGCGFDVENLLGQKVAASPSDIVLYLKEATKGTAVALSSTVPLSVKVRYTSADEKRYRTTLIVKDDGELAKLVFGGSHIDDEEQ
jgi:hypothetical protein